MSSKFGQIRSGTTEFAALEHLNNQCCPFFSFHSNLTVVVIPGKKSGERLQDHWSSGLSWLGSYMNCTSSKIQYKNLRYNNSIA